MADKTLKTRIISKHASYEAWADSALVLLEGEIALASINTTKPDGQGGSITVPTYLMKVGDGKKAFKDLNWLAAPASDVYAWAKKASLELADIPTMDADHIPQLPESKIEGLTTKLDGYATRIADVEKAVGTGGSVAEAIDAAIGKLDVAESKDTDTENSGVVISAISETDGKISVTRRKLAASDVPELAISKVTGLQDKLDELAGEDTTLSGAISKETEDRKAADTSIESKITELSNKIGNLTNIMNFRGAVASKDGITDPVEGDVIAVTAGDDAGKEFIYSDGAWVELGYTDGNTAAIGELKTKVGTLETKMSSVDSDLATIKGSGEGSIAKAASDALAEAKSYADTKKAEVVGTNNDASTAATVAGAKKYADEKVKALTDGAVKTNTDAISGLTTRVSGIEGKYVSVSGDNLVDAAGNVIIFDCGGIE